MWRERSCEFRETSRLAPGMGQKFPPPVRVGAGKLPLNQGWARVLCKAPASFWILPRCPSAVRIPLSTAVRCYWISLRNPERKGLQELAARLREKFRNMAQPPYFILVNMGQLRPREGGAESQGRTPSQYIKLGAALTARFSSRRSLITSRLSFPAGQLENTKEFIKK